MLKQEFEKNIFFKWNLKYCDKCSAQRKKDYENIDQITIDDCEDE